MDVRVQADRLRSGDAKPAPTRGGRYLLQAFVSAFLAILFLQSGIDKVVDRRGNLGCLRTFSKSPLAGVVR